MSSDLLHFGVSEFAACRNICGNPHPAARPAELRNSEVTSEFASEFAAMSEPNSEVTTEAIAVRLKAAVQAFPGSSARVAALSGVPKRTLDGYLAGETSIPADRLAVICDVIEQDVAKLLYGAEAVRSVSFGSSSHLVSEDAPDVYAPNDRANLVQVPLYANRLSAGGGEFTEDDEIIGTRAFDRDWLENVVRLPVKAAGLALVRGDSMERTLYDHDLTLLDRRDTGPNNDDIYALRLDGELLVKRLQRGLGGTIDMISDNDRYRTRVLSRDSMDQMEIRILGRVRWWAHTN